MAEKAESKRQNTKAEKEVKGVKDKVIELIEGMTVLELSDLVKALEEKFGVSAAPVVAQAAQPVVEAEKVVEEKVEFDVILKSFGDKKIPVIKAVREVTNLGLKEAKDLVDGVPCTIREKLSKEEAEKIAKKIEAAGGVCEVR